MGCIGSSLRLVRVLNTHTDNPTKHITSLLNKVELGHPVSRSRMKVLPLWLVCCLFVCRFIRGRGPALGAASPSDFWKNKKGARVGTAGERSTAALCRHPDSFSPRFLILRLFCFLEFVFIPHLLNTHTQINTHAVPPCSPVPTASSVFY